MRRAAFCICENRDADTAQLIIALVFRYIDSTIPLLPNPKFQASSHLQSLHSLVCVGPGQKKQRQVFLGHSSYVFCHKKMYVMQWNQQSHRSACKSAQSLLFIALREIYLCFLLQMGHFQTSSPKGNNCSQENQQVQSSIYFK